MMSSDIFKPSWQCGIRLDPRTKLFLLIVINIVMMTGRTSGAGIWVLPVFAAIPVILTLASRKYALGITWSLLYALCWYSQYHIAAANAAAVEIVFSILAGVVARVSSGFAMAVYFIRTTTIGGFLAAMEKLHLPQFVTIPISVVFRFLPTIAEESASIRDCIVMRGLSTKSPVVFLEYRLVPLLVSMTRIGDELSAAALTKGMGGATRRIPVANLQFRPMDVVFGAAAVLACIAYMIV